jgi:hypothetical protein
MTHELTRVRVCSMLLAMLMSTLVLGATVVGMQPDIGAGDVLLALADLARTAKV